MKQNFLQRYKESFDRIQGYFNYDAAMLFMAYNELIAAEGVSGDSLEIGVHHGLSAVIVASLRGENRQFYAVDLFEDLQSHNVSASGAGERGAFFRNMNAFYDDTSFIRPITSLSTDLSPADFQTEFSFCHIDGGHSAQETYHDLELCQQILKPGGLLALDDYFHPAFPGVCEGAVHYMLDHPQELIPLAIGFNKVLFRKPPDVSNINAEFADAYPRIPKTTVTFRGKQAYLFQTTLLPFFDLARSTPKKLLAHDAAPSLVLIEPQAAELNAKPDETVALAVRITNKSAEPLPFGDAVCGLSYHLLAAGGAVLKYDNPRTYFSRPLKRGESMTIELQILAPRDAGAYLIEIDVVLEDVAWFKEKGNETKTVPLKVK